MKPSTVLIVDDDEAVRKMAGRILSARGFKVLEAQNGLEAVQLYGSYHAGIALVLSDVQMPVMDGLEGLRRMKEIQPAVRAVLMSGGIADLHEVAGRYGFLRKPFTPDQLWALVEKALR